MSLCQRIMMLPLAHGTWVLWIIFEEILIVSNSCPISQYIGYNSPMWLSYTYKGSWKIIFSLFHFWNVKVLLLCIINFPLSCELLCTYSLIRFIYDILFDDIWDVLRNKCELCKFHISWKMKVEHFLSERTHTPIVVWFLVNMWCFPHLLGWVFDL